MMTRHVTLIPTFDARGTAGYQAVLVCERADEFIAGDVVRDILRRGPFCDAALVARSRAIAWGQRIGEPIDPHI